MIELTGTHNKDCKVFIDDVETSALDLIQKNMNIKQTLSCLAASLLLTACSSENLVNPATGDDAGNDGSRREVLLSFKKKGV